jgi:hypothetical protein
MRIIRVALIASLLTGVSVAQTALNFAPLDQWKAAVLSGNTAQLAPFYSVTPAAQIKTVHGMLDGPADAAFWANLKCQSMELNVVQAATPQPGLQAVVFNASLKTASRTVKVSDQQLWQVQNGVWVIVLSQRDVIKLEQPTTMDDHIYPAGDAHEEIRAAETRAAKAHKRILVVFGADWCYDCHVLDKAFQREDIAPILGHGYEVVHVDVGKGDKNQDLMNEYGVPMKRGIPAIAILSSAGKLLYSQKNGEWERARALGPEDLIALLNKWKPQG